MELVSACECENGISNTHNTHAQHNHTIAQSRTHLTTNSKDKLKNCTVLMHCTDPNLNNRIIRTSESGNCTSRGIGTDVTCQMVTRRFDPI